MDNLTAFEQGIEQFNRHDFYACHDTLEALWIESEQSHKQFYQGILQIAVGCYHLTNLNWRGAVILLGEGTRRIRDYQPAYENVDVASLLEESLTLLETLQQTEPDRISEILVRLEAPASDNLRDRWPHIQLAPNSLP